MQIHIHIHQHAHSPVDDKILTELNSINQNQIKMGKVLDELKAQQEEMKQSIGNIADDIDRLTARLEGGLTPEEAESVIAEGKSISDKLKEVAAKTPEAPAPEPENPPVNEG